jgi:hypothetical protein
VDQLVRTVSAVGASALLTAGVLVLAAAAVRVLG